MEVDKTFKWALTKVKIGLTSDLPRMRTLTPKLSPSQAVRAKR